MPNWTSLEMRITLSNRPASYYKLNTIAARSKLPFAGALWRGLEQSERDYFKARGAELGLSGWAVAVMNFCTASKQFDFTHLVIAHEVTGNAGCMYSPELGKVFEIRQGHPLAYYTAQKVTGTKARYMPVLTNEPAPERMEFDYTITTAGLNDGFMINPYGFEFGNNGSIKAIWRRYYGQYRGSNFIDQELDFNSPFRPERMQYGENNNTENYAGYDFIFRVTDARGLFMFDTLRFLHNGYNWAIDWRCKKVDRKYTGHLLPCKNPWEVLQTYEGARLYSRTYIHGG